MEKGEHFQEIQLLHTNLWITPHHTTTVTQLTIIDLKLNMRVVGKRYIEDTGNNIKNVRTVVK
jgi:hypothetical protein